MVLVAERNEDVTGGTIWQSQGFEAANQGSLLGNLELGAEEAEELLWTEKRCNTI